MNDEIDDMTNKPKIKPKIPGGAMRVSKARSRWEDVRKAAQRGNPGEMLDAVSRFEGIANTMLGEWSKRKDQ